MMCLQIYLVFGCIQISLLHVSQHFCDFISLFLADIVVFSQVIAHDRKLALRTGVMPLA